MSAGAPESGLRRNMCGTFRNSSAQSAIETLKSVKNANQRTKRTGRLISLADPVKAGGRSSRAYSGRLEGRPTSKDRIPGDCSRSTAQIRPDFHFFFAFCIAWENQSLVGAADGRWPPPWGRRLRFPGPPRSPGSERRWPSRSGFDFMERAMRLRLMSTSITVTWTFWPTFTTSEASLTN